MDNMENINKKQEVITQYITNNYNLLDKYFKHQNAETIHRDLASSYRVIPQDRETADQNLFNNYFVKNSTYNEAMHCQHIS